MITINKDKRMALAVNLCFRSIIKNTTIAFFNARIVPRAIWKNKMSEMLHYHMNFSMKKAVVLLSGGIDSSTTAAIAKDEGYEVYALSFDYNQRHRVELEAAEKVALSLKVKKHLVIKFDLREIGGSALTSEIEVPKDRAEEQKCSSAVVKKISTNTCCSTDLLHRCSIPVTYVPARNTIFLSFALGWAEALKAEDIFIGANAVDYSGYPDCRPEYLKAFEKMANLATKASVEGKIRFSIKAPLLHLTKAEIIKKGTALGLDYSMTWSCYDPQPATAGVQSSKFKVQSKDKDKNDKLLTLNSKLITSFVPCGRCDSCLFRAKGFREAGIKDI
ncbi:MAG: 7-cyano-7-deazaguanine synthase QueC [Thermodesulfovibrionales bacterium]|nr:7-cyano-7-deazaguanine synthase QueC [Thermodesulfovibrionales bacterium]